MAPRIFAALSAAFFLLPTCLASAQGNADPVSKWHERMSTASRRLTDDMRIGQYESQLQSELALQEQEVAMIGARHSMSIAVWAAVQAYSQSPRDPQSRAVLSQTISQAHSAYYQAVAQAVSAGTQGLSQSWNVLAQNRSQNTQVYGQAANESLQVFGQSMPPFDGRLKQSSVSAITFDPSPAETQARDQAEQAFSKQVNAARAAYRAAMDQANARWDQSVDAQSRKWIGGKVDQTEANRVNRAWQVSVVDAMDDLRSAFKSALRKYRAQVVD